MRRTGLTIPKKPRRNDFQTDICANCGHTRVNHKRVNRKYSCQFEIDCKIGLSGRFIPTERCECKKFVKNEVQE